MERQRADDEDEIVTTDPVTFAAPEARDDGKVQDAEESDFTDEDLEAADRAWDRIGRDEQDKAEDAN